MRVLFKRFKSAILEYVLGLSFDLLITLECTNILLTDMKERLSGI